MIRHLLHLTVGVGRAGIGTALPAGTAETQMRDFTRHAEAAAALRTRGMTGAKVAEACADNWLRMFGAAST